MTYKVIGLWEEWSEYLLHSNSQMLKIWLSWILLRSELVSDWALG